MAHCPGTKPVLSLSALFPLNLLLNRVSVKNLFALSCNNGRAIMNVYSLPLIDYASFLVIAL